jgi:hypothetical protein
MATTAYETSTEAADGDEPDGITRDAEDAATRPATDLEPIADACEIVSRRVAELRADLPRPRAKTADPREARR